MPRTHTDFTHQRDAVYPSSHFDNSEDALLGLCEGCIMETGWLASGDGYGECGNAEAIAANEPDSIELVHGMVQCPIRYEMWKKKHDAEVALYERRMAGDWS